MGKKLRVDSRDVWVKETRSYVSTFLCTCTCTCMYISLAISLYGTRTQVVQETSWFTITVAMNVTRNGFPSNESTVRSR